LSPHSQSTLVRTSIDSRPQRLHQKFIRKPSRLTLSVAGATVLAAVIAVAAVMFSAAPSPLRKAVAAAQATSGPMAAATLQQLAQLRAARSTLTDQHLTVLGITAPAPAPVVQVPQPAPSPAAPAPAPAPAPQQPAAAAPAPATPSGTAQQIAMSMLASYGWSSSEFSCLEPLWQRESGWNVYAGNPDGAYGIPQALPGSKMASAGADWQTNAGTQIQWGLGYIQSRYGSPCAAWSHSQATGWY
jgi:hypothetical protein